MNAWVAPTWRAIRWRPLALAPVWLFAGGAIVWAAGIADVHIPVLCALGVVAATAVLCLDDPAHALLAALPTTVRRRHARRLMLIAPIVAGVWASLTVCGKSTFAAWPASTPLTLMALLTAGLAAAALSGRRRPDVSATIGATFSMCWVVGSQAIPTRGAVRAVADVWLVHPWWTTATAITVAVAAENR